MATFYKWPEAHGLPSLSPACIQVETCMRMTGQPFVIQSCSTTTRSPTGMLPAIEVEGQFSKHEKTEFAAARSCISLARKALKDLDAQLGSALQAEVLAFTSLVEQKLDAATEHSMWVEPSGYKAHVQVAYASQPFPLNYIMPLSARREVLRRWGEGLDGEAIYAGAVAALGALADKLRASAVSGPFLMGAKPCSLDALVFGHLLFYRSSPSAAPALQSAVLGHTSLQQYVSHMLNTFFSTPVPTVQQAGAVPSARGSSSGAGAGTGVGTGGAQGDGAANTSSGQWSDAAKGQKKPEKTPELSAVEREFRRKSWWWLGGAAAVMVGYIVLSGRYINVEQLVQVLSQAQEDDDDEGDDDDDGVDDE